ncbi:ABC transporter ATP-binding protein [Phreatobacter aquaticus]|uniref:ABC transporter ATP-binding protein n=1 Tax=Phreatobacter aquaticus TaxID=2570229 RepID=A0A4D7QNU8_9HYPH|nr:ABC transporter ATP-binding protein [Phreatobacter aquaticus]QCK87279.1 ABC transporter ATP-binding protein [Phreatobacter aquaticus]
MTFPGIEAAARWGRRGTAGPAIAQSLGFDRVSHAYGKVRALDDVTLAIEPGEIVCLLGPSGCGKTTLLRIASGIEQPIAGRVLMDGREVAGPGGFVPPERRGIGLVFQDFALFPHLTNLANVMFGLKALPKAEAERVARLALDRVGLAAHAMDYPHALSGGEQQRVALARAVAPRPGILLMDEPFSGLDSRLRDLIREETLAVMRETRATCIVVTHDPEEAMRMADRIVLMRAGRIVQQGSAGDLYRRPIDLDAARFFSDINEVPGIVRGGKLVTPVGYFAAPGFAEGAVALAAIRPQAIFARPPGMCVPGRLIAKRFLGEVDFLEIAVDGLDQPLKARVRSAETLIEGRDIGVDVAASEVLVFAVPEA